VLKARAHPVDEPGAEGAKPLVAALKDRLPRLELVWVDGGDKRRFAEWVAGGGCPAPKVGQRVGWVRPGQEPPLALPKGFRVLPRRWVVERTFAWLGRNRRLGKDYEALSTTEDAWIYLGMIRLLAARLAQ